MDMQTLAAYASGLAILGFLVFLTRRRSRYRFPPGPRGLPFWGNVFDLPEEEKWLTYLQWSHAYGESDDFIAHLPFLMYHIGSEVIHLKFLSKNVFVLNSALATKELLEKRSHMYSDRSVEL